MQSRRLCCIATRVLESEDMREYHLRVLSRFKGKKVYVAGQRKEEVFLKEELYELVDLVGIGLDL